MAGAGVSALEMAPCTHVHTIVLDINERSKAKKKPYTCKAFTYTRFIRKEREGERETVRGGGARATENLRIITTTSAAAFAAAAVVPVADGSCSYW